MACFQLKNSVFLPPSI